MRVANVLAHRVEGDGQDMIDWASSSVDYHHGGRRALNGTTRALQLSVGQVSVS